MSKTSSWLPPVFLVRLIYGTFVVMNLRHNQILLTVTLAEVIFDTHLVALNFLNSRVRHAGCVTFHLEDHIGVAAIPFERHGNTADSAADRAAMICRIKCIHNLCDEIPSIDYFSRHLKSLRRSRIRTSCKEHHEATIPITGPRNRPIISPFSLY